VLIGILNRIAAGFSGMNVEDEKSLRGTLSELEAFL